MGKLNVESARNSLARPSAPGGVKRYSGLDPSTINAMFPDAAAAIATEKAKYTQSTGNPPTSNRNSTVVDIRNSLVAPTISAPGDDSNGQNAASPWGPSDPSRPKSSSGQTPMGQFVQPPLSGGGLRSPRPQISSNSNIQSTTISAADKAGADLPLLSPYAASSGNWASMVNTPMVPTFNNPAQASSQADMVANATAMKLAALSTVNNRFALDDVRKYRRARSNDAPGQNPLSPGAPNLSGANVVMINEHGQVLSRDQVLALQQNSMGLGGQRSRPNSPGIAMHGGMHYNPALAFPSPQNNSLLAPGLYDGSSPHMANGMGAMSFGNFGLGAPQHHEGYISDHSDMNRGRSPRPRRGSSKPPDDPTDPSLLQDIPAWLRSLRLHKYTDNLKDLKWTDLIELDDKQLEDRGVNALGARRKMIKVFEQVKGRSRLPISNRAT
jgi:hypothetical protein